jgi:hypothetical protein
MVEDKFGMNRCKSYIIGCPYALVTWDELPCCVPNQKACDEWRKKYEKEEPEEYRKAEDLRAKLANIQGKMRMQELERLLSSCYK